tara:strand:+ start:3765 stop:4433 length:669 start_codon:yes stop_codon:yes gene_type:complete
MGSAFGAKHKEDRVFVMANHVNFTVNFDQINEAATTKLKEIYARIRNEEGSHAWFSDMFVEGDLSYEDTGKYEWTTANIGPKWCYLEEFDETFMNGTSAWCYPEEGITKLLEILEEFDPNIITSVTYEDECPNFVGCVIFEGSQQVDGLEDDYEEIREYVITSSEILNEDSWNSDDEEWVDDESENVFQEEIWEAVHIRMMEVITPTVEMRKESQAIRKEYV